MIHYTPYLEEVIDDPYPSYARLREEAPAYFVEEYNCWFLSRFEDVWKCEIDAKGFTVTQGLLPQQLAIPLEQQQAQQDAYASASFGTSIATVDPPQCTWRV